MHVINYNLPGSASFMSASAAEEFKALFTVPKNKNKKNFDVLIAISPDLKLKKL